MIIKVSEIPDEGLAIDAAASHEAALSRRLPGPVPGLWGQPDRGRLQVPGSRPRPAPGRAPRPGRATLTLNADTNSRAGRRVHAAAETTPLEDARAQAPHPLQARGAAARPLPAVPRGQAAAPGLPPLRLLQGPGDRRRRRGLA